jgi:hypothetical protein
METWEKKPTASKTSTPRMAKVVKTERAALANSILSMRPSLFFAATLPSLVINYVTFIEYEIKVLFYQVEVVHVDFLG